MIDEKKIEEAAKIEVNDLLNGSDDNIVYKVTKADLQRQGEYCFKDGINWFLDNLFHHSDETPKVGKEYLLKATFFNDEGYSFDAYVTSTFSVDGWREDFFSRGYDLEVKEWACIDDLLKGGK